MRPCRAGVQTNCCASERTLPAHGRACVRACVYVHVRVRMRVFVHACTYAVVDGRRKHTLVFQHPDGIANAVPHTTETAAPPEGNTVSNQPAIARLGPVAKMHPRLVGARLCTMQGAGSVCPHPTGVGRGHLWRCAGRRRPPVRRRGGQRVATCRGGGCAPHAAHCGGGAGLGAVLQSSGVVPKVRAHACGCVSTCMQA